MLDNIVAGGGKFLMKKDAEFFEGREAQLLYIAKKLQDATRLEAAFDQAGIDYGVEADEYHGGVIFRRTRVGAFFYVLPEARELAVGILEANGFSPAASDD